MIKQIRKKESTEKSFPFASAQGRVNFEENEYLEEEFFFSGEANVYEECGVHEKKVIHENNPYVNRFIVRRPQNIEKFNGNVVVEILNATAGFDIDRMWVLGAKEIMRDQAVYVGITSRPEMTDSLQLFDQERYREINWKIRYERSENEFFTDDLAAPKHKECETGLFWDMLVDLTNYLREDTEVIPTKEKKYFYLAGWSQSANYMSTYIRYFLNDHKNLFDGYLAAGNVHSFVTPLNQDGYSKEMDWKLTKIDFMPVPYIAVQTETENAHFCGYECRQEDAETNKFKYRCYEIAGSTHDTKYSLLDYYKNNKRMEEIGLLPQYMGIHEYPNDFAYQYPMNAIYKLLFDWVRKDQIPPTCERIEIDSDYNNYRDEYGNAKGGIRTPFVDVPICTYYNTSQARMENGEMVENPMFGYTEYFTADQIKSIYGTKENYMSLFEKSLDKQIEKGFLLEDDREELLDEAEGKIREILKEQGE